MTVAEYKAMQRRLYGHLASTREGAERAVHPHYAEAVRRAYSVASHILTDYAQRRSPLSGTTIDDIRREMLDLPKNLAILDYGCGVGRVMEALASCGYSPDGVDICPEMLGHAGASQVLREAKSRFFLSSGDDCGDAPLSHYDLAYSVLCFQHICVSTVRKNILAAISRSLKPEGVICIQMQFFPGITASEIPPQHAAWVQDKTQAGSSNSENDVWVTADMLPPLLADFSAHFRDLRLQFIDLPATQFQAANGQQASYQHLFISGCKDSTLHHRVYRQV